MQIFILIALVIAIIAVVFALQNMTTVTISFLFWSIQGSLALVLLVTLAVGVLISILASMPSFIGGKWTSSSQRKKLVNLENERNKYKQQAEAAQGEIKELEEQIANLTADFEQSQADNSPEMPE